MNRKQLVILVLLALVVGGVGLFLHNRNTASWQETDQAMGQKILKEFPLNDVTQVRIKQHDAELHLAKVEDQWTVQERWNYPANFSQIGDLLRKMWELKSVQAMKVGPSQYARFKLSSPDTDKSTNAATLLEFKDKTGKALSSLLLGKNATRGSEGASPMGGEYPVGRYLALPDHPQSVFLVSETFSDAEAKPDRWLNKDFFKVEKLRSISVTHTNATNSWKLTREKEGGDLELADKQPGEEFDKNKAYSAGNALSYPSFNDVANPASKPEETGMDKATEATLDTFEGFTYHVKLAPAPNTNDTYYLKVAVNGTFAKERTPGKDEKPEDKTKLDKEFQDKLKKLDDKLKQEKSYEKWTYVVSKWTVDPLLKDRKDFLADKKTDEKKAEYKSGETKLEDGGLAPDLINVPGDDKLSAPPAAPKDDHSDHPAPKADSK